ncbi:MAG: sugar MFS transporter [Bacteroidales bacterium]|jgi:FHS family L-fucose permease-like MFS transporter|nr:sugar MFS transporter [Bacteroidales bacterium]
MKATTLNYKFSLFVIGILYFVFGFVTWLNGTLIPFLKIACELSDFLAYFVTFAFYISYFVMALPSSFILEKTGFKNGIAIGLFVMAIGSALFIPASYERSYILFLIGLFILGTGLSLMQTAVNPYVTILGPIESAAKRISIMGICNKFAGIIAPLLLATLLFSGTEHIVAAIETNSSPELRNNMLDTLALQLINPYIVMTIILVLLGFLILRTHLPEIDKDESTEEKSRKSIWQFPYMWIGVIALFFYVGVEVIAADTVILYGKSLGVPVESAKYFTSLTLVSMVIGYFIGVAIIPKVVSQRKALIACAVLGIILVLCALIVPADSYFTFSFIDIATFKPIEMLIPYTVFFIALLGLANSLVWPAIWPLALDGVGSHAKKVSAFLIMAIAGGALIPLVYGRLADTIGTQKAYWIAIPCYVVILFFAVYGYKIGKSEK